MRGVWSDERRKLFKGKMKGTRFGKRGVKEEGEKMERKIRKVMKEVEEELDRRGGRGEDGGIRSVKIRREK